MKDLFKKDEITDRRVTNAESDLLQAPMELDLTSIFKVIEADLIETLEDFEGSPSQLINEITKKFRPRGGNVEKSLEGDNMPCSKVKKEITQKCDKKQLFKIAGDFLRRVWKRYNK